MLFWYAETVHAHVEIAMTGRIGFVQRIGQTGVGGVDDEVTGATCFKLVAWVAEMSGWICCEQVGFCSFSRTESRTE